jgi:phosphoribosylformylglycinamidine cyclo-ligase
MTRPAPHSGVDLSLGDRCSAVAFSWARRSFPNRAGRLGEPALEGNGTFANLMKFGPLTLGMTSDGIGTKVEVAERTGIYHTLGWDLVAMVVDDLVALGVEPVDLSNILDVDFLDEAIVDGLMRGLHGAADEAAVAVVGGEIAELGSRIAGFGKGMHFNWCATALGVLPAGRKAIDGRAVVPDDAIVALRGRGLRSNGFSMARRILETQFGADWHEAPFDDDRRWGEVLLTPSRIFAPLILNLLGSGFDLHGVAHITGGGIPDKFARVLRPNALGAVLDSLPEPLPVFEQLVRLGHVPTEQAWHLWNMGCGMLVVLPRVQAASMIAQASSRGFEAQVAGRVKKEPGISIQAVSPTSSNPRS